MRPFCVSGGFTHRVSGRAWLLTNYPGFLSAG